MPTIIPDTEIIKPTKWEDGELKPMRVAGRPAKKILEAPSRSQLAIYQKIALRAYELIEKAFALTESKNERIRLEAVKLLLEKLLPNPKVEELGGKHSPISVFINNQGFIPPNPDVIPTDGQTLTPSAGSLKRLTPIQGSNLAPAGKEDNHSDLRGSQTGDNEKGSVLAPVPDIR